MTDLVETVSSLYLAGAAVFVMVLVLGMLAGGVSIWLLHGRFFRRFAGAPFWVLAAGLGGAYLAVVALAFLLWGLGLIPPSFGMLPVVWGIYAFAAIGLFPLAWALDWHHLRGMRLFPLRDPLSAPLPAGPRLWSGKAMLWGLVGGVLCLGWTLGFMAAAGRFVTITVPPEAMIVMENPWAWLVLLGIAMLAPVAEEIVFRGALQGMLEEWGRRFRLSPIFAILITSVVFSVAHAGAMLPIGVKEVQIFGVSIIFGLLRTKFGVPSAVVAHFVMNGAIMAMPMGEF